MKTTAVVPVYNENPEKLAQVLSNLKNYVDDIVVVDDGSAIAISNFQFPISNLTLLRHEINRGQGAALQTGTDFAVQNGAEIIIHFDSDGQHNPEDIPALIKPIEEGRVDFVFGSRYLSENNNIPWTKKHLLHPLARLVNYLFTGLKLSDAHNGLRAFRADIADQIQLTQDRMAHATEIMRLVKQNKIRYTEVAVRIDYHRYGQGFKGGLKVIRELLTGKIIRS
ncbi:MAG TPA: glycosyltransferase family 2 protein [bacterium]|nr:glycosyltransferase family 2 protein [bacterium]